MRRTSFLSFFLLFPPLSFFLFIASLFLSFFFSFFLFSSLSYGNNSPIIYGQSAGVPCAYNLISKACLSAGGGVDTMAAVGSTPSANGASISSTTLTLQPASLTLPGVVTAAAQTFGGAKRFDGGISVGVANTHLFDLYSATEPVAGGLISDYTVGAGNVYTTLTAGTAQFMQGVDRNTDGFFGMLTSHPLIVRTNNANVMSLAVGGVITLNSSYTSCTALTTNGSNVIGCTASDERLKKDIVPFERGLEAIQGLTPKTFKFKDPLDLNIEHSAFIAQNVAKSIPEAVRISAAGTMQLDYWTIIAVQANAINELRVRLEALEGPKVKAVKKAIPMKPLYQIKAEKTKKAK